MEITARVEIQEEMLKFPGLGSAAGNGESDWSGNNDTWQDVRSGGIHRQSQEIIMELIMVKMQVPGIAKTRGAPGV